MNIIEKLNEARKYYKDSYGINLNKKQLKVLNSKDEVVREIFERAEGCTTAASIKAVEYAINNQLSKVLILTPFHPTAQVTFNYVMKFLKNDVLRRFYYKLPMVSRGRMVIELTNGSVIEIRVGSRFESLRGLKADCIIAEPTRIFNQEFINDLFYINAHSNRRQTVLLNQVDLFNGQSINI